MQLELYGLLHINEHERTSLNISGGSFWEQTLVYLNSAITLSKSLARKGISFVLLTNSKDTIDQLLASNHQQIGVREIPCITRVPSGIDFYSAHFKIDAYRYLSSLNSEYVGLCDLDVICLNNIPLSLTNLAQCKIPMYYDISDQVISSYGQDVIIRDLNILLDFESEGRWAGGEFLLGSPDFFERLMIDIDKVYGKYIANIDSFHHIGDEMILTAALEIMRRNDQYIAEAGALGIIGRYWNTKVRHIQKSLKYYQQCFLLHLPADKRFLSTLSQKGDQDNRSFAKLYASHNLLHGKIKSLLSTIM